eukprot:scaffold2004_cov63-Cyclotella_meneghiniana.AAC.2
MDYNSICGLCGIVLKVGDWIEKLYIRKDNLNNRRPSGYWCCVICPKRPVPGLTLDGGEQRWNPRNGYFCLWNGTTDFPRYYKWDGKRQHWRGSARGTYRLYSNNDWRSSPRYDDGVKQEYSPGVGEVINTTKHNVNTSSLEDIIQNICEDAIAYADKQRKNSGSCTMYEALEGV